MSTIEEIKKKYQDFIQSKQVAVFMKGSPDFPMCGFSARTVDLLREAGVKPEQLAHFDILGDEEMRSAAKEFSQWPTFPQVFVKGEFVGGCDIIVDLFEQGELQTMIQKS